MLYGTHAPDHFPIKEAGSVVHNSLLNKNSCPFTTAAAAAASALFCHYILVNKRHSDLHTFCSVVCTTKQDSILKREESHRL